MIQHKAEKEEGGNISKTKDDYSVQGRPARYKHWFALDIECIGDNFVTRESKFYKQPFQHNIKVQVEKLSTFSDLLKLVKQNSLLMFQHWNINR